MLISSRHRGLHLLLALLLLITASVIFYEATDDVNSLIGMFSSKIAPFNAVLRVEEYTRYTSVQGTDQETATLARICHYTNSLRNTSEVTIVTAYFNLGRLEKRWKKQYSPELYKEWMETFRYLDNPLIVFVDTNDSADYFRRLRTQYPSQTKIFLLSRTNTWAFNLSKEIEAIYQQPNYPQHPPNTKNPLYSCAMHAKFELVQYVVERELYSTPYIAWLDIGLFREEIWKNETIKLCAPAKLDQQKVAYSQVGQFQVRTPWDIISHNEVWVGGASFLATPEVARSFSLQYRRAVRKLLDMKMMSTDQQVIYSMFQPSFFGNATPIIQTQTIANGWFGVGYLMKNTPCVPT